MKKVLCILGLVFLSISFQSCTDEAEQAQELHEKSLIDPGNDGTIDDGEEDEPDY